MQNSRVTPQGCVSGPLLFTHFKVLATIQDTVHKYTENITITAESLCLEEKILKKWCSENSPLPNFNNAKKLVADIQLDYDSFGITAAQKQLRFIAQRHRGTLR